MLVLRDRSVQTCDDITVDNLNSASSPNAKSRSLPPDDLCTNPFGLPAPEMTSCAESMSFRLGSDDDDCNKQEETGSELLLCSRCGAQLTMHDATVGRYRALRALTPLPSDDVIESRDRQARASLNRTPSSSSLRHQSATAADAAAEVMVPYSYMYF